MLIFKNVKDLQKRLLDEKKQGKTLGFVPTMGALHLGHLSLIEFSRKNANLTVCSIFVNPTQFNDKADFAKYPITVDKDIELLVDADCDVLFLPGVEEIYPNGYKIGQSESLKTGKTTLKSPKKGIQNSINFGFLAETLEGEYRPGHFSGMVQVVERLLRIVSPDTLYMGQKDYQQQLIVGRLIKKLNLKTRLVDCPTMRESDGLAMSSRNMRLDVRSRKLAVELSKTLNSIKREIRSRKKYSLADLVKSAGAHLKKHKEFEVEYLEIRDAKTLEPIEFISSKAKAVALVAVKIGGVRLIDNILL